MTVELGLGWGKGPVLPSGSRRGYQGLLRGPLVWMVLRISNTLFANKTLHRIPQGKEQRDDCIGIDVVCVQITSFTY